MVCAGNVHASENETIGAICVTSRHSVIGKLGPFTCIYSLLSKDYRFHSPAGYCSSIIFIHVFC